MKMSKILLLFLTVIACLFYVSCEKDLFDDAIKNESANYKVKKISFTDFKQNRKALNKLRESILKKNSNVHNRGVYFDEFGVYIDTTDIRVIEDFDKHSITFRIINQEVNNKIENLVLQSKENGDYEVFITEYVLSQTELYQISQDQYNEIEKYPDAIKKLEGNERIAVNSECVSVVSITTTYCKDNEGNLFVSQGNLGDCPIPSHEETYVVVSISSGCLNQYGGTFGSSFTDGSGATGTGSTGGNSGGGIGVSSPSTGANDSPIITTPILNLEKVEANIISILEPTQLEWWNNQPASNSTKHQIRYFFSFNEFSEENREFTNQFITQTMLNPDLNLNFETSIKSPANIDMSRVQDTTAAARKFRCVYEKLTQSPEFKRLFTDMFEEDVRLNVIFEISNLSGNANIGTVGETEILNQNPLNNLIRIDSDLLQNGSTMMIAKTIIHECIHAFLNFKLCDQSIGMSIPSVNNLELFSCINQYYGSFTPNTQDQHDFIYNHMLPTLKIILSEIKDTLVSPQNNSEMQDLTLHYPLQSSPGSPWDWNDFYENLSLNGLQNCNFFQNEIGTFDGQGNILNTVDATKMSKFNSYNYFGHLYLQRICI